MATSSGHGNSARASCYRRAVANSANGNYTAEDLGGNQWTFSQSLADVAPEAWGAQGLADPGRVGAVAPFPACAIWKFPPPI